MKTSIILSWASLLALTSGVLGCAASTAGEADTEPASGVEQADSALRVGPAAPPPTPDDVYIEGITTGGPGCPRPPLPGHEPLISSDRKSFLIIYDDLYLNYPPGPLVKNLNCVAGVKLHIPAGWQFSVATVNTRGYAYLSSGLRARQTSRYYFAGDPIATEWHSTLYGYFDDNYSFTDYIGLGSWSRCGGSVIFAIDTSINLNAVGSPGGTGYMNVETTDGRVEKEFYWAWRPC